MSYTFIIHVPEVVHRCQICHKDKVPKIPISSWLTIGSVIIVYLFYTDTIRIDFTIYMILMIMYVLL